MNTEIKLAAANLRRAQEEYDHLLEEQKARETFFTRHDAYVVLAKIPVFDQFVSYPNEGVLVGVFTAEQEAHRYMATFSPPAGTDFVLETVPLYG